MVLHILRSKKFARRVLIAILILIIPAFVLWGVGNIANRPQPVGKIGNHKITAEDFVKSRQGTMVQVLLAYFSDYNTMNNILRNRPLINYMSWERLVLLYAAKDERINVSNKDVITFLTQHPLFQRSGVFDKEVYSSLLRNPAISMSPRQFEELVRENLLVKKFRESFMGNVTVTDEEVLEEFKKNNDKVALSMLVVKKDPFLKDVTVTDEEIKSSYEENKERFFIPEKVEVEYIEFPYSSSKERDAVTKRIKEIYPELTNTGVKFKDFAKGENLSYGKTEPFSREDVPSGVPFFQAFQDTAFSLGTGQIGPPVFSAEKKGSAYIIRKTGEIPLKPFSFEEIRKDLKTALKDVKSVQLAKKKADDIFFKLSSGETTFDKESKKSGNELITSKPVKASGYIDNIGPAEEFVLLARKEDKGSILDPLTFQKGAIIVRVDEIYPADESSLSEEGRGNLKKKLLTHKQIAVMDGWFKKKGSEVELKVPLEEL